ncbi:FAD-dependent oxidoreductase [Candidatus Woesearchaeota archaeon]|nr:FAD-dependent oxidoreductase [Candidatus Woesearchaeota archaeon]
MSDSYDIIVIGAASAGMPAAIYSHRFGLKTLIIGAEVGGLLNESHKVENYPGFIGIPGRELMTKFKEHVESFGIEIKQEWVKSIEKDGDAFTVTTGSGTYDAKSVVLTLGSKHRHLGIPGEEEFSSKGVSFCPTCDAAFFKNAPVAVIGGGDGAASAASLLAEHASKVYVIVRKDHMRAEPINLKKMEENEKIEILYNTAPVEFVGENALTGIKLNNPYDGKDVLPVEGAFIMIGSDPQTEMAAKLGVKLDERKEIIIDGHSRTNVPLIYAAGDAANRPFKQTITGAAEGVAAAFSAFEDVRKAEIEKR